MKDWPFGVIKTDTHGRIQYGNSAVSLLFQKPLDSILHQPIQRFLPSSHILKVMNEQEMNAMAAKTEAGDKIYVIEFPVQQERGGISGLILLFRQDIMERIVSCSDLVVDLKQELETIMNLIGELVTITDGEGRVLRVNAACERVMGVKEWEFVGQSVTVLEEKMVIDQSSTKKVLENKQPITIIQKTKSGRRLLVSGYPIFNETGVLTKVINISKDITELDKLTRQLEETKRLARQYESELSRLRQEDKKPFIFKSKVMEEIYDLALRLADVDSTVLILGESGVGKEVLARTIHQNSSRRNGRFLKINCGAIPESLMESELFGYEKGTFTGGNKEGKKGIIVSAHNGTLFLDEIGELPPHLQVKLLQVLQEKRVTPLGSTDPIEVDVRFIAATNRNLEEMVKKGEFREDLYYRINVIPITIPSLRERKEDIPFLIDHFFQSCNRKYGKSVSLDERAMQLCVDYPWYGNVRELQNFVERLVVTSSRELITPEYLPNHIRESVQRKDTQDRFSLKEELEEYEKKLLRQALQKSRTMKEVSQKLGVDISTISRKIKKYKLDFVRSQ